MPDYAAAFYADVVARPDDDAVRLIYADWLDEAGPSPLGEFIRVQHALERAPPDDPDRPRLSARQDALIASHGARWRASLPARGGVTWGEFSRGFVESATVADVPTFLEVAPDLFRAAPVRRLRLSSLPEALARRFALSPWCRRLRELDLGNQVSLCGGVGQLASSPHFGRLASLLLHNCQLGDEAAEPLASAASLPALRELYLSGDDLERAAVADSPHLGGLEVLDLRDNRLGDDAARSLAGGRLGGLVTLFLVNNRIGGQGAEALAATDRLPRLRHLYLNHNPLGDRGAAALAGSPNRAGLRELDLRRCGVGDAGAEALAGSPHLEGLRALWMDGNPLSAEGVARLRARFGARARV